MLDRLGSLLDYVNMGFNALDSIGMTIAIVLMACILASLGGMVNARMRLYGAIVGGMILNVVVKTEGGSYAAALAATVLVAGLAFAVGSVPFLAQLSRRARPARR